MAKLALSLIARNNYATIGHTLQSVAKYVDAIFITDTGSTDLTLDLAKEFGAVISHFKWCDDFAAARNFAFAQISDDYDYILWLDTDDVLTGGENLRQIVEEMASRGYTATHFNYNYMIDPDTKQVLIKHVRERIVERGKYEWKGRLHETLIPLGKTVGVFSDLCEVNHYPPPEAERVNMERNLRILEQQYEGEGETKDPRTEFYLARSYFDLERYSAAEALFTDYLEHSGWDEERAMAWNYLGEIYKINDKPDDAIPCFLSAVQERPDYPTWWINLAMTYALKGDYAKAMTHVQLALHLKSPENTAMILNPRDDMAKALEVIYVCSFQQHKLAEAWAAAQKLAQMYPNNETFQERFESMTLLRKWEKQTKAALDIAQELEQGKDADKLESFLNSLPLPLLGNQAMTNYKNRVLPPKTWPQKSIVYFCGKAFEQWDPSNLEVGIGGSESAVIYLAKEWVKAGYAVTVFGYPKKEGEYDGVDYQFYWRFNPSDTFDVFIAWRNESLFTLNIKARVRLIDLHDVVAQVDYSPEIMANIDYYMVKSHYHRSFLPEVPEAKFKVISNGIALPEGVGRPKRDPNLITWVSSYDRGLQPLLQLWPELKASNPNLRLNIAYGWDLFDKLYSNNPERQMWKKKVTELMTQPGITHLGRLSKVALHELHRKSAILAYYCTFEEINCISVLEAQMNGAIPVTTDYAALPETNVHGVRVAGDMFGSATKVAYVQALTATLQESHTEKSRQTMSLAIRNEFRWGKIAQAWIEVFGETA